MKRSESRPNASGTREKNPQESKIGLTMRQIGLGKLQWLDEDNKKKSKGESDE